MTKSAVDNEFQAITRRLYEAVSAPAGERQWESVRELYHPRATMVRTGVDEQGRPFALAMTFDEYIDNVTELLDSTNFSETEIRQDVTVFGNIARLASVYEFRSRTADTVRQGRGVNFFNLVNEGQGWKIMNIVWDNEREGLSLSATGLLEPGQ
mgnify:CR=1 FL=1|jgi:hypothetical protein